MPGIPPALDSDTEDVTWALQTAEALWKRSERSDALVWLRRAAQAAGEAQHDDRALALAHDAAELAEWITTGPAFALTDSITRSIRPVPVRVELPATVAAMANAPAGGVANGPRNTQPDDFEEVSIDVTVEPDVALPSLEPFDPRTLADDADIHDVEDDDLEPILHSESPRGLPASPSPPAPRSAIGRSPVPPAHVLSAAEKHAGMLDPWADSDAQGSASGEAPTRVRVSPAFDADEVVTSAPPIGRAPLGSAVQATAPVDLSGVEALSDLPDDARDAFARAAVVRDISNEEEISGFALALILEGSVYLAATIVDTPAERLEPGEVIRARGTIEHVAPIRLVAVEGRARVAVWDERAVEEAFRICPWVEDDLRAAGDRLQALVGVTMGALGERLDPELRAQVASRLTLRALSENEVFASRGKPIPGLLVVGAGELELVREDGAPGALLRAGDFLFPNEVLIAAPAPNTVRATKGGALVLFAERHAAQELLVTCPPLLEIFAGA
jgi:CRP-like cAMP-binding protein